MTDFNNNFKINYTVTKFNQINEASQVEETFGEQLQTLH